MRDAQGGVLILDADTGREDLGGFEVKWGEETWYSPRYSTSDTCTITRSPLHPFSRPPTALWMAKTIAGATPSIAAKMR